MGNEELHNHRELSAKSAASPYPDASSTSVAETMISLLNPAKISGTPKASHASTLLEATRTRIFNPAPVTNYSSVIRNTKAVQEHVTHRVIVFQSIPELLPILLMLLIFARHKLDPSARSACLECTQEFVTSLGVIEFTRGSGWRLGEYLLKVESRDGP